MAAELNDVTSAGPGFVRNIAKKETEKYIKAVEADLKKQLKTANKQAKEFAQLAKLTKPQKAPTK